MKGDFTRDTFDVAKHFRRVLMQQGRVQLDADWNEQAAILLHYLQTLAVDLIGLSGGPEKDIGFGISQKDEKGWDFWISPGRYYVDGILCENEKQIAYTKQPDFPLTDEQIRSDRSGLQTGNPIIAYLDVWERHITFLDDDSIREVALGGPDTATRAKLVCQVKLTDQDVNQMITNSHLKDAKATMQAQLKTEDIIPDPCITAPDSKYRGAENQLYRVEIHRVNLGHDQEKNVVVDSWSFKWSRENGSVVAAWLGTNEDGGLIVSSTHGFEAGSYIEITSENDELHNVPGQLVRLTKVEGGALYLDPGPNMDWDENVLIKFRQWDQRKETNDLDADMAVIGKFGEWIDLEKGIQVCFEPGNEGTASYWFCTGDYWQIPARVVGGQIEWPTETDSEGNVNQAMLPPRGIQHHYAPLWKLQWENNGFTFDNGDLRNRFSPIT